MQTHTATKPQSGGWTLRRALRWGAVILALRFAFGAALTSLAGTAICIWCRAAADRVLGRDWTAQFQADDVHADGDTPEGRGRDKRAPVGGKDEIGG